MESLVELHKVGEELVEVADAILVARDRKNDKSMMDNIHAVAQLLLDYKRLNRAAHRSLDDAKQTVITAKNRCDAQHLRLQNLLYEQAYLTREIQRCKDFQTDDLSTVSVDIGEQLVADEYSDALPATHTRALEALSNELQRRKSMQSEMDRVLGSRDGIQQAIEEKTKFLSELPSQLLAIEQAVAPLQGQFQMEVANQAARDSAAQALPFPLYTLYKQLEGYREAFGMDTLTTEIVQSQSVFASNAKQEHSSKRQRTGGDSPLQGSDQWKPASLALQVKLSVPVKCLIQKMSETKEAEVHLLFQYVPSINCVVVEAVEHNLSATMPFTSSQLLLRLFPRDTGASLPNLAALFSQSNASVQEYPATATARPFMWAQWICGLRSFSEHAEHGETYLRVKSVTAVINRLRARLATLVRLHHQLELLEKKANPITVHPALSQLLPDAAVTEVSIRTWTAQDAPAQDSFAFPGDASFDTSADAELAVHRSEFERDGCVYYKVQVGRQRPTTVNLTAIVEIPPDYPLRPPQFCLQSRNGPLDNHLKLVQSRLNANWQQFLSIPATRAYTTALGGEALKSEADHDISLLVDMLLSHQVRALQTLFAAFSSSVSGEQEAMSSLLMRPPRRGRDRHRASASLLIHSRLPRQDNR